MNILILSAGTRNKIVQYFRRELHGNGKVIATDCSELAPAIYEADEHYIVPRIDVPDYIATIIEICRKEKIKGVLSLIDPELSIISAHKREFEEIGTTIIGSDYEKCELSMDKYEMYCWLKSHGYKTAITFKDKKEALEAIRQKKMEYPVFIKPIRGSASIDIVKADNEKTIDFLWENSEDIMMQEYLEGQEIGVDVYVDMISHQVVSIFAKKKLRMRSGETDKSVSFKDDELFNLVKRFVKEAGFLGQIDIDLFKKNGEYFISEVNPRFGGGYPHAYECGVNSMKMIINNLAGKENPLTIGEYEDGVYMLKYSEICILRKNGDDQ
ncbi:ATP-grasp domain-containing protein [Blautia sp. MSJ-9]|uniref:ATP-grasp domain-containing protein n=1 Tax=Blautia sp. MSJ-9 TaxID=2841511 RepID=UPI001C0FEF52|nr:ATP-grasp domain-containing protein [Blautia sp. MSJ-9]MBU5681113.1 ATP-grasp domain-containing protein [Blautia sp. MSJ-9]